MNLFIFQYFLHMRRLFHIQYLIKEFMKMEGISDGMLTWLISKQRQLVMKCILVLTVGKYILGKEVLNDTYPSNVEGNLISSVHFVHMLQNIKQICRSISVEDIKKHLKLYNVNFYIRLDQFIMSMDHIHIRQVRILTFTVLQKLQYNTLSINLFI